MTSSLFIFDLDDTLAHTTRDLRDDFGRLTHLSLLRGVRPLLKSVQGRSILLTAGNKERQQQKIDHLKLGGLFSEIQIVANREEKEDALRRIVAQADVPPERIVVVGDRIDHEIRYANKLGCTTVRMRLRDGKYKDVAPESGFDLPMYEVQDAAGLADILLLLF